MDLLLGKVLGVLGDPLQGERLGTLSFGLGFVQAAVAFDLADLCAHARTEQGLFVDKGDTHQVAVLAAQAPGDIALIAGVFAQGRHAHQQRRAASPGAVVIASHAAEADSVQPLPRNARVFAQGQFNRNIVWMR